MKLYLYSKRIFDILLSIILLPIIIPIFIIISACILIFSGFPIFHWSKRVGKNNQIFLMPKFRTMINAPEVSKDLLNDTHLYITPIGHILRKTSIDELPQIWTIIKGEMSFVGPRPALFNQYELIDLRNKNGINKLIPGLTGLAQISGRDNINLAEKVSFEIEYLNRASMFFDLLIIVKTFYYVLIQKNISH